MWEGKNDILTMWVRIYDARSAEYIQIYEYIALLCSFFDLKCTQNI